VNDWYEVLGVSRTASSEEIAAAYRRLVPLDRNPNESEDEAEMRRLREYAYGVLSNPDSRARYDAERSAAAAPGSPGPAPEAASDSHAQQRGGVPLGPLVAAFGIVAAIFAVVALILVVVANDDDEEAFPDRDDDDYDLEAMRLRDQDMPAGFEWTDSVEFTNEEWRQLFFAQEDLEDPEIIEEELEAKLRELESEGRIRNLLSVYQSEELGRTLGIFSISTLYDDADSASESLTLYCGLPVDERRNLELRPLQMPALGDESSGFISDGVMSSPLYSETTFCFRTGRVVHAISLASLPGVEDIGLAVRLAEHMEERVEAFYNGDEPPEDDLDEDGG
jgi:curved DNA-binding protein CbpA